MNRAAPPLILAPMRGLAMLAFRRAFAEPLREAGAAAAYSPFVPAGAGGPPGRSAFADVAGPQPLPLVPQAIGKNPAAVAAVLRIFKDMGYARADLNAGCPFPMVRKKGRGSGLLEDPSLLARICEAGVETMGPGNFSVKVRLGVADPDTLARDVMPVLDRFPLACVAIHPRTAVQMYGGAVDMDRYFRAARASANPVVYNGDLDCAGGAAAIAARWTALYGADSLPAAFMAGRGLVRAAGAHARAKELLLRYLEDSEREMSGPAPVMGRIKELLACWRAVPRWAACWPRAKLARTPAELRVAVASAFPAGRQPLNAG